MNACARKGPWGVVRRSAAIAAIALVSVLGRGFVASAATTTLIDTLNLAGVTNSAAGGVAALAQIVVGANNVRVDRFATYINPQASGTLTWVIFTNTGGLQYGATQPSVMSGWNWYDSPNVGVVLEAGKTYYLAVVPTNDYYYIYDTVAKYGDGLAAPSLNGGATIISGSVVFGTFGGGAQMAIRIEGEVLTPVLTAADLTEQAGDLLSNTSIASWAAPNGSASGAKKAAATSQLETVRDFLAIASNPSETLAGRCTAYHDAIDLLTHLIAKCDGSRGSWTNNPGLVTALQNAVTTAINERSALGCQ